VQKDRFRGGKRAFWQVLRSELVLLDGDWPTFHLATFTVLSGLGGVPMPTEGEILVGARLKVVDLGEVTGDVDRPRRLMQVKDGGAAGESVRAWAL